VNLEKIEKSVSELFNALLSLVKALLALGIGLFCLYIGWNISSCGKEHPTSSSSTDVRDKIAINVSTLQLWSDYQANEVAADERYKGKELAVVGVVESINKDFEDNAVLQLGAQDESVSVEATLRESEKSKAAELNKGDPITLLCRGKGMPLGSPALSDCLIQ
jgi:putative nucleic acid binding protein